MNAFTSTLYGSAACLVVWLMTRELKEAVRSRAAASWVGLSLLVLALAIRLALPITPSNWYTLFHRQGDGGARFGPGSWVVQEALWDITTPSDVVLALVHAVIGAATVPLVFAVLRARKLPLRVATSAAVFLAIMPAHARVSASWSEHTISSTLTWVLILAAVRGGLGAIAASMVLVPAIALIRFDAWPALVMVPAWVVLRDRDEPTPPGLSPSWFSAWYWALWAIVGIAIYFSFVRFGHPLPPYGEWLAATLQWLPVYFTLSVLPPFWLSPVMWLSAVGAVWMFRNRPRLLATVVVSLLASFVPLGRVLFDLVTARYFLPAIAITLIPAAFGLERILTRLPWKKRWFLRAGVYMSTLLCAIPAYAARYTFQDEYDFLRQELASLPPGCTVVHLPVQHESFGRDVDCCLDPGRSALTLAYPEIHWRALEDAEVRLDESPGECVVYYESPACMLDPAPSWGPEGERVKAFYASRCTDIFAQSRLEPIAAKAVSPRTANWQSLFEAEPPRAALYRVRTSASESPRASNVSAH